LSDFRSRLLDLRAGLPELFDRLCDEYALADSDIIGFTSMFAQTNASLAMARRVKGRNPDAVAVLGGGSMRVPDYVDFLAEHYLSDYLPSGGAAVKVVVAAVPTLPRG